MAEKSSELNNINEPDAVSTTAGANQDEYLEARSDDYQLSDAEAGDIETNTGEAPDETEHIRGQIEETRREMGETIDAIQEKLSFSNISEQVSEQVNSVIETAKDAAYDATIGKARNFMKNMGNELSKSSVVKTAQENPFPFILIGLGVGLLAYNSFSRGSSYGKGNGRSRNWDLPSNKPSMLKAAGEKVTGVASTAYGTVSHAATDAYEGVSNVAGSAYNRVTDVATNAYGNVTQAAHQAYEKAGELGTKAHEQYDHYIEENPLAVGAVALALGAAVGFSIPSTRYEGELLGEARENLIEKAGNAAGELVDKVKQVASEAQKTLGDEAKAQGLTQ
jgi:hypothetical protein